MNNIQLVALRRTGWTPAAAHRYRQRMVRRRSNHDPYSDRSKPRWLTVLDMQRNLVESFELPAGTDLRAAMRQAAERLASEGWRIEGGFEYGFFFCNRDSQRRIVSMSPCDPNDPESYSLSHLQRR